MLAGLDHRTIRSAHHQDSTVHLSGTGDHVLDVIGMARTIDVGIVAVLGLVLLMRDIDRQPAGFFFRGIVDLIY